MISQTNILARTTVHNLATKALILPVTVDYNRPIAEAIKATKPDWKYLRVEPHQIPIIGKGSLETEATFFGFDGWVNPQELLAQFEARNLYPDPILVLAVSERYPNLQLQQPFATMWHDDRGRYFSLSALHKYDGSRGISIYQTIDGWSNYWSFIGRPKSRLIGY